MKILKCSNCGEVGNHVYSEIVVSQSLKMDKDGKFFVDSDFDHLYGRVVVPLERIFACPECNERAYEIIVVDKCPHSWHEGWGRGRECMICGLEQRGRVVFD